MATLAQTLLDLAEHHGVALTDEQIATVPAYQREIYAEELERHRHGRSGLITTESPNKTEST